ncbi:hypothetical protein BRC61_04115 [Halobacteriales archaeon QH_10_65_19]|nr:MAG: hypothetical protein BRC61_04115 [Halobacteriales archaeon QH_10_65_19]
MGLSITPAMTIVVSASIVLIRYVCAVVAIPLLPEQVLPPSCPSVADRIAMRRDVLSLVILAVFLRAAGDESE